MFPKTLEFLDGHWGKVIGVVLGLVFGWFAVTYGFWRTMFVALTIAVGYFLGKQVDERTDWQAVRDRLQRGK